MKLRCVLFDLDGTLLPMDQEEFTKAYFHQLAKKLAPRGYEPTALIDAVWSGTAAMVKNDGQRSNEEAFVSLPLLVSFMPMLMDTAGNCGNQISTLMVRGLALGEVEPADFMRVLGKELRVSAIVGAVLGIVNGLRIYLMYTFLFPGQYANVMGYAIVVSVSLFFSVILAKMVGGMLPLAAKKLGADPAIMATPFITTIVDACSLILYFQIAQLVFHNMM